MVPTRRVAMRHHRPAEIERAANIALTIAIQGTIPADHGLHHLLAGGLLHACRCDKGGQFGPAAGGRPEQTGGNRRVQFGKVALKVQHQVICPVRIDQRYRLEGPVGPRRMIGACQHRLAARIADGGGDPLVVGGHPDGGDVGLSGAVPDMADHRLAADIGKRLSGKTAGRHTRRNDDHG